MRKKQQIKYTADNLCHKIKLFEYFVAVGVGVDLQLRKKETKATKTIVTVN